MSVVTVQFGKDRSTGCALIVDHMLEDYVLNFIRGKALKIRRKDSWIHSRSARREIDLEFSLWMSTVQHFGIIRGGG